MKKVEGDSGQEPRLFRHVYMDRLRETVSYGAEDHKNRQDASSSFPGILYFILSEHGTDDVISWQPHGRAFIIRDPGALVRDVLPQ
mgnify:CR=1 FL=1